jgi:cyclic pyranopterin phosphate synthase
MAQPVYDAGLRRINVSLDSLSRQRFHEVARRDALDRVLEGLQATERAGFYPIKVNTVAMRGRTEGEILDFARLAMERGFHVRFIEFMPLDAEGLWGPDSYIPGREIIERIAAVYPLEPVGSDPRESAVRFRFRHHARGEIGIIPSVSEPFCGSCSRVRITADGKLRTCLFALNETDLREPLRNGASDLQLADLITQAVRNKEQGHRINHESFVRPERSMSLIGG